MQFAAIMIENVRCARKTAHGLGYDKLQRHTSAFSRERTEILLSEEVRYATTARFLSPCRVIDSAIRLSPSVYYRLPLDGLDVYM